jgi:Tfp pilus assembly protein PilX
MQRNQPRHSFHPESGAITILVALMLLVLLTVAAVGMSRNSFRETVISGTSRQGAMTRNLADSGIEWGIYWLDTANSRSGASGSASKLIGLRDALLQGDSLAGRPMDPLKTFSASGVNSTATTYNENSPPTPPADLSFTGTSSVSSQGFTTALTRMGKLPITDMSQGTGPGAFAPAQGGISRQAPDLWAVRSDAQVVSGLTFTHAKEAWITTPVQ